MSDTLFYCLGSLSPLTRSLALRFATPLTPTTRRYLALPKTGAVKPPAGIAFPAASSASTSTQPAAKRIADPPREANDLFATVSTTSSRTAPQHTQQPPQAQRANAYDQRAYYRQDGGRAVSSSASVGDALASRSRSGSVGHALGGSMSTSSSSHLFTLATSSHSSASNLAASSRNHVALQPQSSLDASSGSGGNATSSSYRQKENPVSQWAQAFAASITSSAPAGAGPSTGHKRERTVSTGAQVRIATGQHERQTSAQEQIYQQYNQGSRPHHDSGYSQQSANTLVPSSASMSTLPKERKERPILTHSQSTANFSVSVGPAGYQHTPANANASEAVEAPLSAPSNGAAARLAAEKEAFLRERREKQERIAAEATAAAALAVSALANNGASGRGGAAEEDLPSTPRDVRVRRAPMTASKTGTARKAHFKASRVQLVPAQTPSATHESATPSETDVQPKSTEPELTPSTIAAPEPVSVPAATPDNANVHESTTPQATPAEKLAQAMASGGSAGVQKETSSTTSSAATAAGKPALAARTKASVATSTAKGNKSFRPNTTNIVQARKVAASTPPVTAAKPRAPPRPLLATARPANAAAGGKIASSTTVRAKAPLATSKTSNRGPLLTQKKVSAPARPAATAVARPPVRSGPAGPVRPVPATTAAAKKFVGKPAASGPGFAKPTSASVQRSGVPLKTAAKVIDRKPAAAAPAKKAPVKPATQLSSSKKVAKPVKAPIAPPEPATEEFRKEVTASDEPAATLEQVENSEVETGHADAATESQDKDDASQSDYEEERASEAPRQQELENVAADPEAEEHQPLDVVAVDPAPANSQDCSEEEEEASVQEIESEKAPQELADTQVEVEVEQLDKPAEAVAVPLDTAREDEESTKPVTIDEAEQVANEASEAGQSADAEEIVNAPEQFAEAEEAADEAETPVHPPTEHAAVVELEESKIEAAAVPVSRESEMDAVCIDHDEENDTLESQDEEQQIHEESVTEEMQEPETVPEPQHESSERLTSMQISPDLAEQTAENIFEMSMPTFTSSPAPARTQSPHKRISILSSSAANTPSRAALQSINLNTRSSPMISNVSMSSKKPSPLKVASPRRSTRNIPNKSAFAQQRSSPERLSSDGHLLLENDEGNMQLVFGTRDSSFLDDEEGAEDDTIILQPGLLVR